MVKDREKRERRKERENRSSYTQQEEGKVIRLID